MAVWVACQCDEIYSCKLFLIILCGTFIVLCAERCLFVLSIFVHAVRSLFQRITIVGSGDIVDGHVRSQRHAITDRMVNVQEEPVPRLTLYQFNPQQWLTTQQVKGTYEITVYVIFRFLVRQGFPQNRNNHLVVHILTGLSVFNHKVRTKHASLTCESFQSLLQLVDINSLRQF